MTDNPHRLASSVRPRRYELVLRPDLESARFDGEVTISIELDEATRSIALHAAELDIAEAAAVTETGTHPARVRVEAETERIILELDDELPAGSAHLELSFSGELNDKLRGFYRSTYTTPDGETRTIATTQFESTNARRAFPCFDQPDLKATFAVTLEVDPGLMAVSCERVVSETVLDSGRRRVSFAETMPMSTYLVAFVVGELERTAEVDVDGVPLAVVHVPGQGHLAHFALECGAFALRWLTDYYGIAYPGGKIDMVAVPDFAFGAMENLGCVTFRETLLLVDPERSTQAELTRIADVISHELAHMWFGDLVTMSWWDGIWLKEAFATFMEMATVAAFRPAWQRWEQFSMERSAALDTDALTSTRPIEFEVISPADAEGMYDVLTYEKGAAVVRMLEQYLGAERFRDGIRRYLADNAYGNTENRHLWEAIEAAVGEPVAAMMDTWILQGGYPLVEVSRIDERTVRVSQRRFLYLDDGSDETRWIVPLVLRSAQGEHRLLLEADTADVDLGGPSEWVVANAGGDGFYRVAYDAELRSTLVEAAQELLSEVERHHLVDDAWAAVLAGAMDPHAFWELVEGFAFETDLNTWKALVGGLRSLERALQGEAAEAFRGRVAALVGTALDICGWEPAEGESPLTGELRGVLVEAAGRIGHDSRIIERARRLDGATGVDADLAAAALRVVASHGDADTHAELIRRRTAAATPQEERRMLFALALLPGEAEMAATLELAAGEVRTQDAPYLLALALAHPTQGEQVWRFVARRWDELNERFPSNSIVRMISGIASIDEPALAAQIEAFFAEHSVPQGERTLSQHLEKMKVMVATAERARGSLA